MFTTIVVALDTSSRSEQIVQGAVQLAKNNNASILLLHILSSEEEGSPIRITPGIEHIYWAPGTDIDLEHWQKEWQQYEQQCLEQLQSYANQAIAQGINTEVQQIPGAPGKTICEVARNRSADLIMIGNRGRRGVAELVLGSVSNYVLHHAPCSVLVVKPSIHDSVSEPSSEQQIKAS